MALQIWHAGVDAVDAEKLVGDAVQLNDSQLCICGVPVDLTRVDRIMVLGGGKASGSMAVGLSNSLGEGWKKSGRLSGWINVPDDQVFDGGPINIFGARPAGENLPTETVVEGTRRILELANSLTSTDICIFLISGGGSALLELPVGNVSLSAIRDMTILLSHNGATIDELNTVRKRLSRIKGGRLASAASNARSFSLILSDVIGDRLDLIASGPTVKEDSTRETAAAVLGRFDPSRSLVSTAIWKEVSDPRPADKSPCNPNNSNFIIGNNQTALRAAGCQAEGLGLETRVIQATPSEKITANAWGEHLADQIICQSGNGGPVCFVTGGEPIVDLCEHPGRGGRNQQLVLATLCALLRKKRGSPTPLAPFCLLSGGTDGEDGNVSVAGAWIDNRIINATMSDRELSKRAMADFENYNSHSVLKSLDCLVQAPPIKTNVCDLRVLVLLPS